MQNVNANEKIEEVAGVTEVFSQLHGEVCPVTESVPLRELRGNSDVAGADVESEDFVSDIRQSDSDRALAATKVKRPARPSPEKGDGKFVDRPIRVSWSSLPLQNRVKGGLACHALSCTFLVKV